MIPHPALQADDFTPELSTDSLEQLSRPSLSYWQDAWIRLKKNTRAIISLYLIIGLALFTILGPFLWTKDPSAQDLDQISQAPALPKTALLVSDYLPWTPPVDQVNRMDWVFGVPMVAKPVTASRVSGYPVGSAGCPWSTGGVQGR
jgi:hypothetical protein